MRRVRVAARRPGEPLAQLGGQDDAVRPQQPAGIRFVDDGATLANESWNARLVRWPSGEPCGFRKLVDRILEPLRRLQQPAGGG